MCEYCKRIMIYVRNYRLYFGGNKNAKDNIHDIYTTLQYIRDSTIYTYSIKIIDVQMQLS